MCSCGVRGNETKVISVECPSRNLVETPARSSKEGVGRKANVGSREVLCLFAFVYVLR